MQRKFNVLIKIKEIFTKYFTHKKQVLEKKLLDNKEKKKKIKQKRSDSNYPLW